MAKKKEEIRVGVDGLLECVDSNGDIKWRQGDSKAEEGTKFGKTKRNKNNVITECVVRDGLGNDIKVPVQIPADQQIRASSQYPYNPLTAEMIANEVAGGKTFMDISLTPGFPPYHTISYWLRKHKDFKKMVTEARISRAEVFHDKIAQLAEDVEEETAKSARIKLDAYKHLSAVNDPDRHGARMKHVGDPDAPIGFIVDTGIRRGPEEEEDEPETYELT